MVLFLIMFVSISLKIIANGKPEYSDIYRRVFERVPIPNEQTKSREFSFLTLPLFRRLHQYRDIILGKQFGYYFFGCIGFWLNKVLGRNTKSLKASSNVDRVKLKNEEGIRGEINDRINHIIKETYIPQDIKDFLNNNRNRTAITDFTVDIKRVSLKPSDDLADKRIEMRYKRRLKEYFKLDRTFAYKADVPKMVEEGKSIKKLRVMDDGKIYQLKDCTIEEKGYLLTVIDENDNESKLLCKSSSKFKVCTIKCRKEGLFQWGIQLAEKLKQPYVEELPKEIQGKINFLKQYMILGNVLVDDLVDQLKKDSDAKYLMAALMECFEWDGKNMKDHMKEKKDCLLRVFESNEYMTFVISIWCEFFEILIDEYGEYSKGFNDMIKELKHAYQLIFDAMRLSFEINNGEPLDKLFKGSDKEALVAEIFKKAKIQAHNMNMMAFEILDRYFYKRFCPPNDSIQFNKMDEAVLYQYKDFWEQIQFIGQNGNDLGTFKREVKENDYSNPIFWWHHGENKYPEVEDNQTPVENFKDLTNLFSRSDTSNKEFLEKSDLVIESARKKLAGHYDQAMGHLRNLLKDKTIDINRFKPYESIENIKYLYIIYLIKEGSL